MEKWVVTEKALTACAAAVTGTTTTTTVAWRTATTTAPAIATTIWASAWFCRSLQEKDGCPQVNRLQSRLRKEANSALNRSGVTQKVGISRELRSGVPESSDENRTPKKRSLTYWFARKKRFGKICLLF